MAEAINERPYLVSIHAPVKGATLAGTGRRIDKLEFQSTHP